MKAEAFGRFVTDFVFPTFSFDNGSGVGGKVYPGRLTDVGGELIIMSVVCRSVAHCTFSPRRVRRCNPGIKRRQTVDIITDYSRVDIICATAYF